MGVAMCCATPAIAGEPATPPGTDELGPAFRYTTKADRDGLRVAVEEVGILGLGFLQYVTNKKANQADWDLAPDWSSVERKATFQALTFDNNYFDTNWLTHPGAGYLYYSAARQNRLSIASSFAIALGASTLWEVFGEIREHAAINDIIATPVTGLALGEPTLQLGALMHRSAKSPASTLLGWALAPFKSLHDALDDVTPARAERTDHLGVAADVWHRLSRGTSVGVTHQEDGLTQGDGRLHGSARIVSIPGYGFAGRRRGWFDGGEVSELSAQAAYAEARFVDVQLAAHTLPFGWATQDVTTDPSGRLAGHGTYVGLQVGCEYGHHDWDRDRRRPVNKIALVATGATLEHRIHTGDWTLRARVDGLLDFAGVDAYALGEERREHSDIHLVSVLRMKGYYHAYGATLRPRVEAENGAFDTGGDLRVDWFQSITGHDVEPINTNTSFDASDRRVLGRTWVGWRVTPALRVSLEGEWGERTGRITTNHASRSELGVHGGAEVRF